MTILEARQEADDFAQALFRAKLRPSVVKPAPRDTLTGRSDEVLIGDVVALVREAGLWRAYTLDEQGRPLPLCAPVDFHVALALAFGCWCGAVTKVWALSHPGGK